MKSRTLVKIKAEDQYLLFRTISQAKKSPTAFYIPRNSLEKLDGLYDPVVVVSNFPDFAEFRRNVARGELQVLDELYQRPPDWLDGGGDDSL